jgi:hypothetical protein
MTKKVAIMLTPPSLGYFQAASLQIPTVIMHTIAKDTSS